MVYWHSVWDIWPKYHYDGVIMSAMAYQIISLTIVYSTVYLGTDQRKQQSSASLAFVGGIHRWSVNSPHKGPVTRKSFPFDDVIMFSVQPTGDRYMEASHGNLSITYSISQEICTRFCCTLLCCGHAIIHNEFTWSIYPYPSGLLCWHWGNR